MIIVKMQGGMGNQLFQYALGRSLAHRYNVPLKFDIRNYDFNRPGNNTPDKEFNRLYRIDKFNTKGEIATDEEIKKLARYQKRNRKLWYLYDKFIADESIYIQEKFFSFAEEYYNPPALKANKSIYLDGYWQTEKYFKCIENEIRSELTLKEPPEKKNAEIMDHMNTVNSVCLHVRRGNFIIPKYQKHHGLCTPEYYQKAIAIIANKVANPVFFIFSDDPAWAREHMKLQFTTVFIDHNDKDYEDLRLMSSCKNFIIANSSFSWWAAWLSKNKEKVVTVPSQILKKKSMDLSDFAPESWVKINMELE